MIKRISIHQTLSYQEVLNLQRKEFELRLEYRKNGVPLPGDVVFFVEHKPVYTLGRHGEHSHLLLSEDTLHSRGIEFFRTDRGGDITYHGPGQLTVYPVIDLLRYRLGVKDYVYMLEESVIRAIAEYGIKGDRIEGKTGVWIGKGTASERKICAIGVRCSRHVSMHGLALNIGTDMSNFNGIVPCGLPQGVTSISLETGYEVAVDDVEITLWNNLISLLQPDIPSQEIP